MRKKDEVIAEMTKLCQEIGAEQYNMEVVKAKVNGHFQKVSELNKELGEIQKVEQALAEAQAAAKPCLEAVKEPCAETEVVK